MLRALAKRSVLLLPPIRRLVADRDECHRSVTTLRAALTERYAARSAASAISAVRAPVLRSQHIDEHARLFANRTAALSFLLTGGHVAETGVGYGDFSEALLRELKPSLFHGYDIFPWDDSKIVGGMPASERLQGRTHQRYYEDRFAEQIADDANKSYNVSPTRPSRATLKLARRKPPCGYRRRRSETTLP